MSEASLWKWLREQLPRGHATRVESEAEAGFPDVHFTMTRPRGAVSVTFELKYGDGPKKQPLKKHIRKSQVFWIKKEVAASGLVWIVAEIESQVYFIPGKYIDKIEFLSLGEIQMLADLALTRRRAEDTDYPDDIRQMILRRN